MANVVPDVRQAMAVVPKFTGEPPFFHRSCVRDRRHTPITDARTPQLATIHDFDAGGMLGTTDVGARRNSPCFIMVQVQDGEFVRVYPKKKASFDCTPANRVEVELDLL